MIKIGLVGYGYWGPNVFRNFHMADSCEVTKICDRNIQTLSELCYSHPQIKIGSDFHDITRDSNIDAVAIVTPISTHYEIAKDALENGKHIFIEKPFTANADQAKELIEIADRRGLTIMVDHTFVFTPAVRKVKDLMDEQVLGDLNYYDSTRVNLGLFQTDANVIWDLAPHDFSIMDYLIKAKPVALATHAMDHFDRGFENIAYVTIYFDKLIAHFNLNWLSPVKVRLTMIGGQKKMLFWDDLKSDEKIKVYDRGVTLDDPSMMQSQRVGYRLGDVWTPQLDTSEALQSEVRYFVDCVQSGETPINDGRAGLRVVELLEASDRSLRKQGALVKL